MKTQSLETDNPYIRLIEPDMKRDAPIGLTWLQGRNTLRLMGVSEANNKPSSLEKEKERITGFIENPDQLNWMISFKDKVVGAIWVDLKDTDHVPAPAIHMMVGDAEVRNQGIGSASSQAVINFLRESGYSDIYSRHLVSNERVAHVLAKMGFTNDGEPYTDADVLRWQNVALHTPDARLL